MITPGSLQDWIVGAGIVGAFTVFATTGYRWMLSDGERVEASVPSQEFRDFPVGAVHERQLVTSFRPGTR
jgi:hypothetical protein